MQMLKYQLAESKLLTSIHGLMREYELKNSYNPIEHIKSRIKKEESIVEKLKEKNYDLTIENMIHHIHDIVGIRIVCSFLSDVYEIVNILKNSGQFEIMEEQDYIKNPKKSGYQSYHILVKVPIFLQDGLEKIEAEIQIRTVAMDFWASLDHKIAYKFRSRIPLEIQDEMYRCSLDIQKLDHEMLKLNNTLNQFQSR